MEYKKYIFVCLLTMSSIRGPIQRRYSPVHITQVAVERNHNLIGAEWIKPHVHH